MTQLWHDFDVTSDLTSLRFDLLPKQDVYNKCQAPWNMQHKLYSLMFTNSAEIHGLGLDHRGKI